MPNRQVEKVEKKKLKQVWIIEKIKTNILNELIILDSCLFALAKNDKTFINKTILHNFPQLWYGAIEYYKELQRCLAQFEQFNKPIRKKVFKLAKVSKRSNIQIIQ